MARFFRKKRTFRKRSSKAPRKFNFAARKGNVLSIAQRALTLARRTAAQTTETKYLRSTIAGDLAGTGSYLGSAFSQELTDLSTMTPVFSLDGVTGNKSYLKYLKGYWEIHMDNVNNEEETVNFTVAVVKLRKFADTLTTARAVVGQGLGQPFFNPQLIKTLYKKHFTLTMGGVSPGTIGPATRFGQFYIPVNKAMRLFDVGIDGQNTSRPASEQDRYYFLVYTDNTSADLENPRINASWMSVWKDVDRNH